MRILNKKAKFEYQLFEKVEAGISLEGHEAKSVFLGRLNLNDAFIRIKEGQAYLVNANIPPYENARVFGYDPKRTRRLLLHKKEILALEIKMKQKKLILVPVSCYNKSRKIKLELALARRRKKFEKKEIARRKTLEKGDELVSTEMHF